jgi:hypothetical protein
MSGSYLILKVTVMMRGRGTYNLTWTLNHGGGPKHSLNIHVKIFLITAETIYQETAAQANEMTKQCRTKSHYYYHIL